MKKLVMALVPFVMFGCGEDPVDANNDGVADGVRDPNNVSVVVPATPRGTVSGQVLGTNLAPLAGVDVALTIGGASADSRKAQTNGEGNFVFADVPGGAQVLLTFSRSGYATLRASSVVPSTAGNVPINNGNASFGPITLAQLNGSLRFLVVGPTGLPVNGARGTIEASPSGAIILGNNENTPETVSNVVVEATSNASGVLTFEGIPSAAELGRLDGSYRVWVAPVDANNDGIPETGGFTAEYQGDTIVGSSTPRLINLPFARTSANLTVENSNVGTLRGASDFDPLRNMVRPGEPIHLFFNHAVQPNSMLVRLTDEFSKESLPITATPGNGGYSATLTPGSGIQEGKEYNMTFRAVSLEGGSIFTRSAFFFGGDPTTPRAATLAEVRYQETTLPPATTAQQINSGETLYVNFNVPVSKFGFGANVQVFFNADIDGNGTIGGASFGEVGNTSGIGFDLSNAEPTAPYATRTPAELPVFPIIQSGYSTRFSFTYIGCGGATGCRELNPTNTSVVVAFSKLPSRSSTDYYETIWGQPIIADMTATGIAQQAAPTPPPP
jgi:hypothetical protein